MKKFKLSDLNLKKADVSKLTGGVCRCAVKIPTNGVADHQKSKVSRHPPHDDLTI